MQAVNRKEKESLENLLRRFNRKVQQSGNLTIYRNKQYYTKPLSKKERREIAIRKKNRKNRKIKQQLYRGL